MKYRCIETFTVDCYDGDGNADIKCGSIWERDDETNIIGADVHLDNLETMEWLEIPEEDLEKYFEPLT